MCPYQPMNNARAALAANAGQAIAAMRDQGVDEGAVVIARRGVDDEAGGLIEHDQIGVFV